MIRCSVPLPDSIDPQLREMPDAGAYLRQIKRPADASLAAADLPAGQTPAATEHWPSPGRRRPPLTTVGRRTSV